MCVCVLTEEKKKARQEEGIDIFYVFSSLGYPEARVMSKANPPVARIRRFDEIDTDSEFDAIPAKKNADDSLSSTETEYTEEGKSATKTKTLKEISAVAPQKDRKRLSGNHVKSTSSIPVKNDVQSGTKGQQSLSRSDSSSSLYSYESYDPPPRIHRLDAQQAGVKKTPNRREKSSPPSTLPPPTLNANEHEEKKPKRNPTHTSTPKEETHAEVKVTKSPRTDLFATIPSSALSSNQSTDDKEDKSGAHKNEEAHLVPDSNEKPPPSHLTRKLSEGSGRQTTITLAAVSPSPVPGVPRAVEPFLSSPSLPSPSSGTGVPVAVSQKAMLDEELIKPTAWNATMTSPSSLSPSPRGAVGPTFSPPLSASLVANPVSSSLSGKHSVASQQPSLHGIPMSARNSAGVGQEHPSSLTGSDHHGHLEENDARGNSRSSWASPPSDAALSSALRRLTAENKRLMEEANYLAKENQRYRSAASSASSSSFIGPSSTQQGAAASFESAVSDQVKLQMTVEMLKRELLEREENFFTTTQNLVAERDGLVQQLQECIEQAEGQGAAAAQYEKLYTQKVKELNSLTGRCEVLRREVEEFDKKRILIEKSHTDRVQVEKSRADKFLELLEDTKTQRAHLQQRVLLLQQEVERNARRCRALEDTVKTAEEETRRVRIEAENKLESAWREIEVLKDIQAQRQVSYSTELREERRMYEVLQQNVKQLTQEYTDKVESLRQDMERQREEQNKVLREERQRRLDAENKAQRLELTLERGFSSRDGTTSSSSLIQELEQRLQKYRDELGETRRQRDDAFKRLESCLQEVTALQDTLLYSTEETKSLYAQLAEAEGKQKDAEAQNRLLTSTLQEVTAKEEQLAAQNKELEEALKNAFPMLSKSGESMGIGSSSLLGGSGGVNVSTLAAENERLTEECMRLAIERTHLQEENEKLAEEFVNWKTEIRCLLSASSASKV